MLPSPEREGDRIDSLDVLRGLAVMGILLANLPAFALPEGAYFAPLAGGVTRHADMAAWLATYVLVEGKMRGLFALLFGASMLLVIDRAEAAGRSGAATHYRRMAILFLIGCLHLYGLWWGDILAHYALCGALAFPLSRLPVRGLLAGAALLIVWQVAENLGLYAALLEAQAHGGASGRTLVADLAATFGNPPPERLGAELAAYRGSYAQTVRWRWHEEASPLTLLPALGPETLSTMLLGMAGLRSGFLAGAWPRARYRCWAVVGLGVGLPLYAVTGWRTVASGFRLDDLLFGTWVLPAIVRPLPIIGYASLAILLIRPGGRLSQRIAAVGRCALSNYLGTTLVMTTIFYGYGLGLFGRLPRADLYLLAPPLWVAMLAWSHPWLRRFRYGPAEWLWRSLARLRAEPMRRSDGPLLRPTRN